MTTLVSEPVTKPKQKGFNFTDEHRAKALETKRRRAAERAARADVARMSLADAYAIAAEAKAQEIAGALVNKAIDGDVSAARELADRIYGKATTRIEVEHQHPVAQLDAREAAELLEAVRQLRALKAGQTIDAHPADVTEVTEDE